MFGRVEGESRNVIGIDGVSDKTASSVSVESDHEEKCEVMSVPKCLEALTADLVVSGRIHYDHDEQHEVTSDAARLGVVNILCALLTDLCIGDEGKRLGGRDIKTHEFSRR